MPKSTLAHPGLADETVPAWRAQVDDDAEEEVLEDEDFEDDWDDLDEPDELEFDEDDDWEDEDELEEEFEAYVADGDGDDEEMW
jgi:hypothetical protein